ncbi:hypothetical protein KP509_1Z248500 [Ceratopteris richardii]|nr:hypothetical protein KP509_1Z248500 [Ceratopteris richardii]
MRYPYHIQQPAIGNISFLEAQRVAECLVLGPHLSGTSPVLLLAGHGQPQAFLSGLCREPSSLARRAGPRWQRVSFFFSSSQKHRSSLFEFPSLLPTKKKKRNKCTFQKNQNRRCFLPKNAQRMACITRIEEETDSLLLLVMCNRKGPPILNCSARWFYMALPVQVFSPHMLLPIPAHG